MALPRTQVALIREMVAPMHASPDAGSEQVSQALLAAAVRPTEHANGWTRIETADGYSGWVEARTLCPPPLGWGAPFVRMLDLWVNLRGASDSRCTAVLQAAIGVQLPLLEPGAGAGDSVDRTRWAELLLPDGRRLWTEAHRVGSTSDPAAFPRTPAAVRETAARFLNVPYLWGGSSPAGLDCSGFVQLVFGLHGVPLRRDAHQQAEQGEPSPRPDPGDLLFFGPAEPVGKITHVALALDRRRMIHAVGSDRVRIDAQETGRYAGQYRCARRVLPAG
jgi:cell wall-associated NlpC family hydrolase